MGGIQVMGTTNVVPYVGPRPFQRLDEALFFGREREAGELLSLIIANPILLLYARSGAGKTSLINARLVPQLEREGLTVLPIARVQGRIPTGVEIARTPSANVYVFNTLASCMREGEDPKSLVQMTLTDFLTAEKATRTSGAESPRARVLVFDQFEELFTFYPDRWMDRLEFFQQVSDLLEGSPRLLRADDLMDPAELVKALTSEHGEVSNWLRKRWPAEVQTNVNRLDRESHRPEEIKTLVDALNLFVQGESLFDEGIFSGISLRSETRNIMGRHLSKRETPTLNRRLLEDAFPKMIRRQSEGDPLLRVVFSMREDYIAELDPYASVLPTRLRSRYRLEPLRRRAALLAVKGPIEKTNLRFAPGVADHLVDNLLKIQTKAAGALTEMPGEFIEPVQLQVVCQSLWDNVQASGDSEITEEHLRKHGNVGKALRAFYENAIQNVGQSKGVKEAVLRRWFEETLITTAGTRGMVFRGETSTGGLNNQVVDELEIQHVIRAELRGGERWYELSHDRFIQPIRESNNDWRLARSGAVSKRNELEAKAAEWVIKGSGDLGLLDESAAVEAGRWLQSHEAVEVGYSKDLFALVQSSRLFATNAQSERERAVFAREKSQAEAIAQEQSQRADAEKARREEQERRAEEKAKSSKRLRKLVAGLAVLFVLAFGTAVYAIQQKNQARAESQRANQASKVAIEQTKVAELNAEEARTAKAESERQRVVAEKNLEKADEQRKIARAQESLARAETLRANVQTAEARRQQLVATAAKNEAQKQRSLVEAKIAELNAAQTDLRKALVVADDERSKAQIQAKEAEEARNDAVLARRAAEENLKKFTDLQTVEGLKDAARSLAARNDVKGAIATYQRALVLYQAANDNPGRVSTLEAIARLQGDNHDYVASIKTYEEVLPLVAANDLGTRSRTLSNIGFVYVNLQNGAEAIKNFEKALDASRNLGDNASRYEALYGIAIAKLVQKDYGGADKAFAEALAMAKTVNDPYRISSVYDGLGDLNTASQRYSLAAQNYENALKIRESLSDTSGITYTLTSLINVYTHMGNKAEADKYTKRLTSLQPQKK
jgi:tetratricopeptide (TPR) repeat protein